MNRAFLLVAVVFLGFALLAAQQLLGPRKSMSLRWPLVTLLLALILAGASVTAGHTFAAPKPSEPGGIALNYPRDVGAGRAQPRKTPAQLPLGDHAVLLQQSPSPTSAKPVLSVYLQDATRDIAISTASLTLKPTAKAVCEGNWASVHPSSTRTTEGLLITLLGQSDTTALIQSLTFEIVKNAKASIGWWPEDNCGRYGSVGPPPRLFSVHFDGIKGSAETVYTGEGARARPTFTLTKGEYELFQVELSASACVCSWRGLLNVIVDGVPETITLDNHGAPFVTVDGARFVTDAGNDCASRFREPTCRDEWIPSVAD